MVVFEVVSEVKVPGVGKVTHTHEQKFSNKSNVFERVSEYRHYMNKVFPKCEFKLISTRIK